MAEAEGELSVSGIVPRACSDVLRALEVRRAHGVSTLLRVSYVEIYGEQVTDLLNENVTVGQWQGVAHRAGKTLQCLGVGWGEVKKVGRRSCHWRLTQLPSSPPLFPPPSPPPPSSTVFAGDCAVEVEGASHLRELLLKGEDSKRRAATAMNHRSSRAHCLLMLSLTQSKGASGNGNPVEDGM